MCGLAPRHSSASQTSVSQRKPARGRSTTSMAAQNEVTLRETAPSGTSPPARSASRRKTATYATVLGAQLICRSCPPRGGSRRLPAREEVAARAAGQAGTTHLSTLSGCRVEDVRRIRGPVWHSCISSAATRPRWARSSAHETRLRRARRHDRYAGRGPAERDVHNGTKELVSGKPSRCSRMCFSFWRGRAGWRPICVTAD
jgi:hypothetical protein